MSTNLKARTDDAPKPARESLNKKPQQDRSKASLERMLSAARELMLERGNEEFTLQEVSQRGNVSIGSIYLRFESKDNLVRSVIGEADRDIAAAEGAMFEDLQANCLSLGEFVPRFVEAYAEVLRTKAPLLRLSMERASFDPLVSVHGKARANEAAAAATSAMLVYKSEVAGPDQKTKAESAFHVIFATLARRLSLGSTAESVEENDWELLKRELGKMCLAYLRAG
jgi:AcrR family transcriptional regulator